MTEEKPITDVESNTIKETCERLGIDPSHKIIYISAGDLAGNLYRAILSQATGQDKIIVVDSMLEIAPKEMQERIEKPSYVLGEHVGMTFHDDPPKINFPSVKNEYDPGRISGLVPKHANKSKGKKHRGKRN